MTDATTVAISGVTTVVTTDAMNVEMSGVTTGVTIGMTTVGHPPEVRLRNPRSPSPKVPILSGQPNRWMPPAWQLENARWKNASRQENSRQHHPRTKRNIEGIMITGAPMVNEIKFIQTTVEKTEMAISETGVKVRNSMRTRPGRRDPVQSRQRKSKRKLRTLPVPTSLHSSKTTTKSAAERKIRTRIRVKW